MSAITSSRARLSIPRRGRLPGFLVPLAVAVLAAVLVFGVRVGVATIQQQQQASQLRQLAKVAAPMPSSPQIEEQWGVRFTLVQMLASNGLVEMRYVVLDNTKANRLHEDSKSLSNIPTIRVDGTDGVVKSNSLMFHVHNELEQGTDGRFHSIVYGNAGNAIHPGSRVTIVMPDGLSLHRVPVY